jgi:Zn-dependent peptidase ImmA (M78 family)
MAERGKEREFRFRNGTGIEYSVVFRKPDRRLNADGTCASPDSDHPVIHISPHLSTRGELNTAIHEFAHAFFWNESETTIKKFANSLSRFLYLKCKWRKE